MLAMTELFLSVDSSNENTRPPRECPVAAWSGKGLLFSEGLRSPHNQRRAIVGTRPKCVNRLGLFRLLAYSAEAPASSDTDSSPSTPPPPTSMQTRPVPIYPRPRRDWH